MLPIADSHPAGKFPFWVILIIIANVYVFFLELTSTNPDLFISQYALIPSIIDFSTLLDVMPFITSQFLHGGFLHIISNMLFLWVFGDNVEARIGNLFFPLFYLTSGAIAAFAQFILSPNSSIPMLGASGAVAGVLGAYFALFPNHKVKTLVPFLGFLSVVNIPAFYMLVYWFITQVFAGTLSLGAASETGGVAYFAHIGGFVFGWAVAKLFYSKQSSQEASAW